jgi:TolB-like protein/tetratricopeptide (TPR) repeat protein
MIGHTVSHYKIVRKIGEGGMGRVYLADDTRLDRQVALKFLPSGISHDPDVLLRFDREAKAAAALSHPNIITVHEVGVSDDQPYIAMAYVEGTSLSRLMAQIRLTIGRVIDIGSQVCEGLAEAHQHGIVHRDIKPENIHVDRTGRVRILDFGLALRASLPKITQDQSTVGTIRYMSPEQAAGNRVDHRSDIFSLGTVLYEMLTGQVPFDGPHPAAVLYAITNQTPAPIRNHNRSVSEPLARVVERALEKNPEDRFDSATEMLGALRAASGAAARLARARRRNYRTVGITVAGLAGAAALATVVPRLFGGDRYVAQSLAVLPLVNLSGDTQQDFFVDGMTEALITRLAQIKALRVISRTSVMRYRNTDKPLEEIAHELKVGVIVQGAVLRSGDQIRVTAQLIDAASDNHLWAATYNAVDVRDVISLQSTVASEIAQEVSVRVTPDERERLGASAPAHPEAYEAFLQGRFYFNHRTPQSIARAVDYFNQAIELDSTFAPAYAGIADCYTVRAMWNWDTSQNTFPMARFASQRALSLDPNLADAHASLAMVQLFYDWDWASAEKSFRKAIALNRNYATAYHWYGLAFMTLGRYEDAIRQLERACDLDPFSPIMLVTLSQAYDMNGQYELALQRVNLAFDLFPQFGYAWLAKSWIAYHQQNYQEAVDCSRTAMSLKVDRSEAMLVASLVKLGDLAEARRELDTALARPEMPYHVRTCLYAYYGDFAMARKMAEKAIDNREWFVVAFRSRWFEPLHADPGFDEFLERRAPVTGAELRPGLARH